MITEKEWNRINDYSFHTDENAMKDFLLMTKEDFLNEHLEYTDEDYEATEKYLTIKSAETNVC